MSEEQNNSNISSPKTNIKLGLANMINEYNNLPDNNSKQSYINSVIEWYMREKSILSVNNNSNITENRYSSSNPYSRNVK